MIIKGIFIAWYLSSDFYTDLTDDDISLDCEYRME